MSDPRGDLAAPPSPAPDLRPNLALVLGSGIDALRARDWPKACPIIAINNAWQIRPDWDYLIHPEDFPPERHPPAPLPGQNIITAETFVPAQNRFGGFVWGGGTMAFTAAYWVLDALRPKCIAVIGCDMVYPASGDTHFYGIGTADPLRQDITLRSLEAKSARFSLLAAQAGTQVINLSQAAHSRLLWPRGRLPDQPMTPPSLSPPSLSPARRAAIAACLQAEANVGYFSQSGRYWQELEKFDPAEIDRVDGLWLAALNTA